MKYQDKIKNIKEKCSNYQFFNSVKFIQLIEDLGKEIDEELEEKQIFVDLWNKKREISLRDYEKGSFS